MKQTVRDKFTIFSELFEGNLDFMYLDINGQVTIGVGNLIDTVAEAQKLPFFFKGEPSHFANPDEIAKDWNGVKARKDLSPQGGGAFKGVALLRIDRPAIDALIASRLNGNENMLKNDTLEFANFDNWPADAQLGLLSMAWAMGAAFAQKGEFPNFRAACATQDFDRAAQESHMKETGNPGVIPRNKADQDLFLNAAQVTDTKQLHLQVILDPTVLFYPRKVQADGSVVRLDANLGDNRSLNVLELQQALNAFDRQQRQQGGGGLQGAPLTEDGNFGPGTQKTVIDFQNQQQLNQSGRADADTWTALDPFLPDN